ncbi:MAG: putative baseplate assembly protein, partial [Acidobacteriota bacterium]
MLDVLTFYQERIANEGYLRTATERRSILELARLVGYAPRPGVASTVYLVYTLDDNSEPVEIPLGARAQSIPEQDALPQSFETSQKLEARKEWNNLKPRRARPQRIELLTDTLFFEGTETNLKPSDPLLIVFAKGTQFRKVRTVEPLFDEKKTKVTLQFAPSQVAESIRTAANGSDSRSPRADLSAFGSLISLAAPLSLPASKQPANSLRLKRDVSGTFDTRKDTMPQILTAFNPRLGNTAYTAWANTAVTGSSTVTIYALRVTAPLFGYSAASKFEVDANGRLKKAREYPIVETPKSDSRTSASAVKVIKHEEEFFVHLDSAHEQIQSGGWVVVDKRAVDPTLLENFKLTEDLLQISKVKEVSSPVSRSEYGFTSKTTRIELDKKWIEYKTKLKTSSEAEFQLVRKTIVYAQSEELRLADEPIDDDVFGDKIELGALYDGLRAGRWIIVSGERTDIPNTPGIRASELSMLAGIEQGFDPSLPGDKIHSTLILANKLAYTYKRKTVNIFGNVVEATHGETRQEVLGSGDAAQVLQAFTLKQPPLTYVSAPTVSGIESTLHVRVNDVEWKESDSLAGLTRRDRGFVTKTGDDAKTGVIFGNGEEGSRLPTGIENVTATYRSGIGKSGNVKAEQISLVLTKPLGVKEVINPLRASGGADKETRDQARRNVPLAVMALDRLLSTRDYADFARTFAGIGKASAVRMSLGGRQFVHLTIAGEDDVPIDVTSGLYRNLRLALSQFGDPYLPVQIGIRELLALVIAANVRILPEYSWEKVAANLRLTLLEMFSFETREIGQSVYLSEVISAMQSVRGVAYVDVDKLDSISETEITNVKLLEAKLDQLKSAGAPNTEVTARLARANPSVSGRDSSSGESVLPAQVAYLLPNVPDTLILNQIEEVKK